MTAHQWSGRTTACQHKSDDWRERDISDVKDAISTETIFNVQWTNCPYEVEKEVIRLWKWQELGNDTEYFNWDPDEEHHFSSKKFPEMVALADDPENEIVSYEDDPEDEDEQYGRDISAPLRTMFPLIALYLAERNVGKCKIHWWR